MKKKGLKCLFNIGKKHVNLGIYAVEKDDIIEMKRDILPSKTKLKEEIRKYKAQGYKVYSNG